jgi:hypothetical protein
MYKSLLGIECPGCGMQRSFIEMLKGDFIASLALYPALLPSMFMIVLLIIHLIFKLQRGAAMLKILFLMNALIIVLHYIYRILT